MLDTDTLRKITLDVSAGRPPDDSYTPEMEDAWVRIHDEFEEWLKTHPGATLSCPPDLPE